MFKHIPVLEHEVLSNIKIKDDSIFIDGTLGLGGHAFAILSSHNEIKNYYGFDVDENALAIAKDKLAGYSNMHFVQNNFKNAVGYLNQIGVSKVDNILLDLGVSSMQLDDGSRGFSFMKDAKLNMRLDGLNENSAMDYINSVDEDELTEVLYELGEESFAKRIANRIIESRIIKKIETTYELRDIVYSAYPAHKRFSKTHPATKTFQALRIVVNGELTSLIKALEEMPQILNNGGRMQVISFHSLEDRIVKQAFKKLSETEKFILVNKKPIIPTENEIKNNPRSRSSKLRIIERIYE